MKNTLDRRQCPCGCGRWFVPSKFRPDQMYFSQECGQRYREKQGHGLQHSDRETPEEFAERSKDIARHLLGMVKLRTDYELGIRKHAVTYHQKPRREK